MSLTPPQPSDNTDEGRGKRRKRITYNTNITPDVQLISSDGDYFQVHSHFLKTFSTVFADMLQLPALSSSNSSPLITVGLPETTDHLRVFLDFCYGIGPEEMSLDLALSIAGICSKYEADRLRQDIAKSLRTFIRRVNDSTMAWMIFKLASQWDDPDLAASAIEQFWSPNSRGCCQAHSSPECWRATEGTGSTGPYMAAYRNAWNNSRRESDPRERVDWGDISRRFRKFFD